MVFELKSLILRFPILNYHEQKFFLQVQLQGLFDYCYINNEYRYNYDDEKLYFAVNKSNKEDIFFMESNGNTFKLNKV